MCEIKINNVPSPTWRFLDMNGAHTRWELPNKPPKISALAADDSFAAGDLSVFPADDIQTLIKSEGCARLSVSAKEGEERTARINLDDEGESCAAEVRINAAEKSRLTVFITVQGSGYFALRVSANVCKQASVRLVFSQLTSEKGELIADFESRLGDSSELSQLSFFPGTSAAFIQSRTLLSGDNSRLSSRTFYLGENDDRLDLNYVSAHEGKSTQCHIKADGALGGSASKLFRGTIDFRSGCTGSQGSETENVMLLDDGARNQTLPIILCSEEDVNGAHGATIGNLSDETLFYFASRGISKEDAERLLKILLAESFCRIADDEETAAGVRLRMGGGYE